MHIERNMRAIQKKVTDMSDERERAILQAIATMPPERLHCLALSMQGALKGSRKAGRSLSEWATSRVDTKARVNELKAAHDAKTKATD